MENPDLTSLIQLISDRIGLKMSGQQLASLQCYVEVRIKGLRLAHIDDYCALLQTVSAEQKNWRFQNLATQEWQQLINQLTVGESYFFRDTKQFELLKTRIFPELIQRKRQSAIATAAPSSSHARPSLRLWSAGCSTGEEVYSLAIMLQELLPDWSSWNIQIIGTDINAIAIEKARMGLYPDWSFRHTQPAVRPQHLTRTAKGWQVSQALKQIVHFYPLNLVSDTVPNPQLGPQTIDFLICRNVFIYFHPDAIAQVLRKFYTTLASQGYLMTGHTELQGIQTQPFQICCFPESILYQRSLHQTTYHGSNSTSPLPVNALAEAPTTASLAVGNPPVHQRSVQANRPSRSVKYPLQFSMTAQQNTLVDSAQLQSPASQFNQPDSQNKSAYRNYLKAAENHADSGEYAEALSACQYAIQLQPFRVEPLYLLAHLAEENDDPEQAKILLKKIIYLDPNAAAAYLELAMIYQQQGDPKRATKQLHHAFLLLRTMPDSAAIPGYSYTTVGDARQYLQQIGIA